MHLTQRTNLTILTAALLNCRAFAISELASATMSELPESYHQRKKRLWRFLSNSNFALTTAQCAPMPAICHLVGIKGLTPIMIDWFDLGRKRNGLFVAVCFRKRGLLLISRGTTSEEPNLSQNLLEESLDAPAYCPDDGLCSVHQG